jgi:hypothetical protein
LQFLALLMSSMLEVGKHGAHLGLLLTMAMQHASSACVLLLPELPWKEAALLGPARHGGIQSHCQLMTVSHPKQYEMMCTGQQIRPCRSVTVLVENQTPQAFAHPPRYFYH